MYSFSINKETNNQIFRFVFKENWNIIRLNYNYVSKLLIKIKISETKPNKYGTKNTKNFSFDIKPSVFNSGWKIKK